jgi:hypothetical protein
LHNISNYYTFILKNRIIIAIKLVLINVYCRRARAPIDTTINGGSANGDAFVDWHLTTGLSLQVTGTAIFILLRVDHVQCHVTPPQYLSTLILISVYVFIFSLLFLIIYKKVK